MNIVEALKRVKNDIVSWTVEMLFSKMDKENPTGTGSFSLNRKDGSTIGSYSFAEGNDATASGRCSHSEGYNTIANGEHSHAEGGDAIASGGDSHAEGLGTMASGIVTHAEGYSTIASSRSQHVQGEYNVEDVVASNSEKGKYAHIVGNGTAVNARSNAHTLDWDGNAWFAGDVYIGGTGQDDETATKLATVADIETAIGTAIGGSY